jgi:dsRNA-specific ribonuclease
MTTLLTVQTGFTYRPNLVLKDLILHLLKFIIPSEDLSKYVEPECMVIWNKSITPEILNLEKNFSYEEQEYLGDRVLKVVFPKYLIKRFPTYSFKYITNIDTLIMEKKHQGELAMALHLTQFVKNINLTLGIKGDLFESFFGALDEVSELVYPELGLINCYNMICFIFNQNQIPEKLKEGDAKMNVEQMFIQLGLSPLQLTINKVNNQFYMTLSLSEQQLLFFIQHHIVFQNTIVAESTGNSKNITIKNVYQKALQTLNAHGVNDEFIEKIKAIKKLEKTEEKPEFVKPVKEKVVVNVKELVLSLLSHIIPNKNELSKYVTTKNMAIWNTLFEEDINEKYRYFGEILIKGLLPRHLMKVLPDFNKENFNNILSNIPKYYHLFLNHDLYKVLSERKIFESFFGMLDEISDQNGLGIGMINCYRLIVFLFNKDLIPIEFSMKHSKMVLDQLFIPFVHKSVAKPIVKETHENDLYTFHISLTDELMQFLNKQGIKLPSKDIGEAQGPLKKQTEREAYDKALLTLKRYGVDEQWATKTKVKLEFEHPSLFPYKRLLELKNKQLGYDYIYFNYPTKTATQENLTLQLIGVKGKNKVILSSIVETVDMNRQDTKVKLIKDYLKI